MRKSYRQIIPTSFELWCVAIASFVLLLAGNARIILERYDLINSSTVVKEELNSHVGDGLRFLDSFSATPALVTFVTWGVIGLVLFSVIQSLVRTSRTLEYERELGSNSYVHPQSFNPKSYWHRLIVNTLTSFGLLALFITSAICYLLFVIPVGFSYVQQLLLNPSLQNIIPFLLGVFTIFAGTALLYLFFKLVTWHHRVSQV